MSNPGSAFLYVGIIGMWALVLVPMWLKSHDAANETKAADRFARAMGTLRRGGDSGQREILMPGRPSSVRDTQVTVVGSAAELSPAAVAAGRRRRVLAVLAGLLVVWTVVTLVTHKVPTWTIAVPSLLVIGFLVVARRQVALAADLRRRHDRRVTLAEAARAAEARYGATDARARRGGRAVESAPVREESRPAYVDVPAALSDSGAWNAVPTTLPTYVTAPRATRMPRVIDLTTPGSWNGAAMVEQARETRTPEPVAEGEMKVETFAITVPRDPQVRAGVLVEPASYADRYVDDDVDAAALAASDDLDDLLADPRTGTHGPTWRRAANG